MKNQYPQNKQTVFLIKNNLYLHGPSRSLELIAQGLKDLAYNPIVITFQGGETISLLKKKNIPVIILNQKNFLQQYMAVLDLIATYKPIIIHSFSLKIALALSPFYKTKKIFSFWGYGAEKYLKLLSYSTTILAGSQYHRELILKNGGPQTVVLYHGLKLNSPRPLPAFFFPKNSNATINIGIMARQLEIKGFPYFFSLIKFLKEKHGFYKIKGEIAGVEKNSKLIDILQKLGLEENIHFRGLETNIDRFFQNIDFYVQTSHSETFGFSLLEAMARGIPCFSFKSGGPEELLGKNEGGLLSEKNNVEQMAEQIARVAKNSDYYQELSWSAQNRVKKVFSWKNFLKNYHSILKK